MKLPRPFSRFSLVLLAAVLAGCDTHDTELPTGAQARASATLAPLEAAGADAIPGRYVVVLHPQAGSASAAAADFVAAAGGQVHHSYENALKGFAATLPPAAVEQLRRDPRVAYVVPDAWAYPTVASWGIDRIDERDRPLDGLYEHTSTGDGVTAYVIDSGIRTSHGDFGGRASVGTDFVGDGQNGLDCNGHGTHVAGTLAGTTYGVATDAAVVSVRVFGCTGGAPFSTIIAAVDWVTANAAPPAVVNMSLTGGLYAPLNQAVQASITSGLVYVLAAGNETVDACTRSPASTPEAITVGASTAADYRASYSNWGRCLDLFAPGHQIVSAGHAGVAASAIMNGTSMAAPHVAGVAALFLEDQPEATQAEVAEAIRYSSNGNRLSDIRKGSPNRLLLSWSTPLVPASVVATRAGTTNVTVTWGFPGTRATHAYLQRALQNTNGSWTTYQNVAQVPASPGSHSDGGVLNGRVYRYRVQACSLGGCSAYKYSNAVSVIAPPLAPTSMSVAVVSLTAAQVRWNDPSTRETYVELQRALLDLDGTTWGAYGPRVTLAANQVAFRDEGLTSGRTYRYQVRACNTAGCSDWFGGQTAAVPTRPAAATDFAAEVLSPTQIQLTWTDQATNETAYRLHRYTWLGSGWSAPSLVATLPANTQSYTNTVSQGVWYAYRLMPCIEAIGACAASVAAGPISSPP